MPTVAVDAAELLKAARRRAGLTQVDLALKAGVTQSVISAYESGARQPSLATLQRLVAATGVQLSVTLRGPLPLTRLLTGPLGKSVVRNRREIKRIAAKHGATNVQVFGSVARAEDTDKSDVDLLVDLAPETGLLGLSRLEHDLAELLGAKVDVVPRKDLKADVARHVLVDAVAL
jgi:predicted nucleotidyltransferase/DNA-binding XRE family transcriptional regulator